jgi:hypothetical protein
VGDVSKDKERFEILFGARQYERHCAAVPPRAGRDGRATKLIERHRPFEYHRYERSETA